MDSFMIYIAYIWSTDGIVVYDGLEVDFFEGRVVFEIMNHFFYVLSKHLNEGGGGIMSRFLGCQFILCKFFDTDFHFFEEAIFLCKGALSCDIVFIFRLASS